ncbi:nickel-dependent hydrogenase large subunit [Escherichia coli]
MLKGVSTWHLNSPEEFTKVQTIKYLVASGQLGIFANGYWGRPGDETAAGSEPDCGSALPAGAGVPA